MRNRQPDESDLGPEPDWLLDAEANASVEAAAEPAEQTRPIPELAPRTQSDPEPEAPAAEYAVTREPIEVSAQTIAEQPAVAPKRIRPWMWAVLPFLLIVATGIIAWFSGTQSLNDVTTWEALRSQQPALIPAPWALLSWWVVLPLLAVFLIYGLLRAGRPVTRIKLTGPLVSISLIATCVWIFAQHWHWEITGLISILVALGSMLAAYFLVALSPGITKIGQRVAAVIPLSASLGVGVMLSVLTWQAYSDQPFGPRGSSVLFVFLLVMIAAVFAFFLRDGLFSLMLAVWFAGVVHQQWGDDTVISLVAIVATLFTVALAVLGTILAAESHRPSLTTRVNTRSSRTSFFRKSEEPPTQELP